MNHLEAFLNAMQADAALIHRPENLRWLANYTGEGCLFICRHAQVIRRGDRVYLKDLGSKNHTYLNGNQIPVGVEIPVPNGSEIRLAGELFVLNRFVQDGGDNG